MQVKTYDSDHCSGFVISLLVDVKGGENAIKNRKDAAIFNVSLCSSECLGAWCVGNRCVSIRAIVNVNHICIVHKMVARINKEEGSHKGLFDIGEAFETVHHFYLSFV
ncbi:hypothetical protein B5X24_HaOG210580 [Helicoverpa armigera]|uniref:Uncharacterized protein n=1 Tax=Helicoverpa armigera TaxID=29058 RepID=A0A2W1BIY4_HELAM|nr:hypothetical protein B5X24_HaOG210580 [Helicoverpa armigera]